MKIWLVCRLEDHMDILESAVAALREATRPKTSGTTINVHIVKATPSEKIDYGRMKRQIEGPSIYDEDFPMKEAREQV